jgi:hypothetical protein
METGTWIALATWILAAGTLAAAYWQAKQQRRINSANMVMMLHDRFESTVMKSQRKQLATAIAARKQVEQKDDEILVFFETIGLLTHQHVLSEDMVWNEFIWEIVRYYSALTKPYDNIANLREASHDKTLYSEFEWLFNRLIDLDCKKRGVGKEVAIPNAEELKTFVTEETSL